MKKALLFLVFLVSFVLTVACGGPRESKETQSSQESDVAEIFTTDEDGGQSSATETTDTNETDEDVGNAVVQIPLVHEVPTTTVYACVGTDTTTCGNRLAIPLQSKRKLTFASVAIQGADLSSLTVHLTFSPKDSGIQRIITEIPTAGKSNALSVNGEEIWNKYNADAQGVIRTFLATTTIKGVLSLADENSASRMSLISQLNTHLGNSPIHITDVNVSFDKETQILVRIPVKKS